MKTLAALAGVSMLALTACGGRECTPTSKEICTTTGTGTAGFAGDGKQALLAELYLPMDVTQGPGEKLYIVDWNNHRLRVQDKEGIVQTYAGTGMLGDGPEGPADKADFNHPTNVVVDPSGGLVIAAWHNSRLKRIDATSRELKDSCGTGKRAYTGDNGPAVMADLDLPAAVAFDAAGNQYVMDQANQVIRKIDTAGVISRFAGRCIVGACGATEQPTTCAMNNKSYCGTDPTACGRPCGGAFAGDNGPALQLRMSQPFGQAADPAGRIVIKNEVLYFADTSNNRVRKIDLATGIVSTVAGNGERGSGGNDGPATLAQLDAPTDVAVGDDGTLYIADTQSSCVRAVGSDGNIRSVVGVCGTRGFKGDFGKATEALLDRPYGIEVSDGVLYIADTHNHRIRVVGL